MTVLDPPHVVRPAAPRAVVLSCAVLGLAAALVLPDAAPGLGVLLLALATAAVLVRFAGGRPRGWAAVHAGTALLLVACAVVRDAPWLVALDLLAALALASLSLVPARTWAGVLRGPFEVPLRVPVAAGWAARGARVVEAPAARPVLRGLALTVALLVVFGSLLVSGDAAFAGLVHRLLPAAPDLGDLPARAVLALLAAGVVAAAAHVRTTPRPEPAVPPATHVLRRAVEWALPLWSLVLLLATFLGVQAQVLLGGDDHVLRSAGVTYASYAREGFGQLLAVTALVLAVVAAAVRWAPRAARPALGALCLLALVVDASALSRLHLYGEAYGLTRLRVTATAGTVGLAVVLLLVLAAGLRPGRWLPHALVLVVGAGLLVLTASDPDARIARSALDRGAAADLDYLAGLSADAVPVLTGLPEPARSCVLRPPPHDGWTSWNRSRSRAAAVLAHAPLRTCQTVGR